MAGLIPDGIPQNASQGEKRLFSMMPLLLQLEMSMSRKRFTQFIVIGDRHSYGCFNGCSLSTQTEA
jgi:hypothetical protein